MYAGSYTGSLADVYGYGPYLSSFSISSTGAVTGTAVPYSNSTTGTYSGTVDANGICSLTFHGSNGTTSTGTAYFAFNPAGALDAYLVSSQAVYTMALAKNYAGTYTLTFGTGNSAPTADVVVSDTGVVTGASTLTSQTPFLVTGTVSSTGTVNITLTSVGEGTPATISVTGTMVAVFGSVAGSGAFTGTSSGNWTATGKKSTGAIYAGSYVLTSGNAKLTFTVDAGGSVTGVGSGDAAGDIVTGAVLANGNILLIAVPTSVANITNSASLSGTLALNGVTAVTGQGSYLTVTGGTGSWTVTGKRG
jgi:hypothetical protein